MDFNIDKSLRKFWVIEELSSECQSPNDFQCEQIFKNTYLRETDDRFVVDLPFIKPG